MPAYQDASSLCRQVKGDLCSFPNYCARSGCLHLPKPAEPIRVDSTSWTGRPSWAGSPWQQFLWAWRRLCWPSYECQLCVGQDWWQGCYCAYHECAGPCAEPPRWMRLGRWLYAQAVERLDLSGSLSSEEKPRGREG